jgi:hypothetical protein
LSGASNAVTFPTVPDAVPASIAAGNHSATITFTPPADGGSPITGYEVLDELLLTVVATGSGSPITVTGLTNLASYTFYIRAVNAVGTARRQQLKVVPPRTPQAPTGVNAFVQGDRSIKVTCDAPVSDLRVADYSATASPGGITLSGGVDCVIQFDNLTAGVAYTFTVVASSAAGAGPASDPTSPVTAVTFPGAPTAVSAVAGASQATVSFTPQRTRASGRSPGTSCAADHPTSSKGRASPPHHRLWSQ